MIVVHTSEDERVAKFHNALAEVFGLIQGVAEGGLDINKRKADGSARSYMRLADVDRACRKALSDHGFSYPQFPTTRWTEDGRMFLAVRTMLCRDGVTMSDDSPCELPVLGQMMKGGAGHRPPDAQSVGSAMTYGRRYSLTALLGMCPADDDGHAASTQQQAPADPKWDAFEALVRRLAATRKQSFDAAYQDVKNEADVFPHGGGPDDQQLIRLTDAAERLLNPKPAEPTALDRLNDAVGKLAKKMAMDQTTAGRLVEHTARITLEGHPTPAQVVTLMGVAERMLAEPPSEPDGTVAERNPEFLAWKTAAREHVAMRVADYRDAEGGEPDEDLVARFWADVQAMSAKAARAQKFSPKTATPKQLSAATNAITKAVAKMKEGS